ncbi:MAG: sodium-dependent transporter [Zetaproteobacteria bacterium]|nr:sodium-dependent transporter [Zetaproteobacteria bacterium]
MKNQPPHSQWASRLGFIMVAAGASVGLGNLQRFPQMVSQGGGAAFVAVYLICVLALGLPLLCLEFVLGRGAGTQPAQFASALIPGRDEIRKWNLIGLLGVLTAFSIYTYYSVNVAWTLIFAGFFALQQTPHFEQVASSLNLVLPGFCVVHLVSFLIVRRGLQRGVEACSKFLMPILLVLVLFLGVCAYNFVGWSAGMAFYLRPDWSLISSQTWILALSQAFFSLCIGEAVMLSFGASTPKKENLFQSALLIAFFDTFVALSSRCILFPALFSSPGVDPGLSAQPGFIFHIMPLVFQGLQGGNGLAFLFFLVLAFAGLTTCIALMEMPVQYLVGSWGLPRKRAAASVWVAALIIGLPSLLSHGVHEGLSQMTFAGIPARGVHALMDFVWGGLAMVIVGLLLTLFAGWVWGRQAMEDEFRLGLEKWRCLATPWACYTQYVLPLLILAVLWSFFAGV